MRAPHRAGSAVGRWVRASACAIVDDDHFGIAPHVYESPQQAPAHVRDA
jgi:hypothetical protein